MGAIGGQMANIDESGATSMMLHAVPHANEFDPHSGDCAPRGPNIHATLPRGCP